MKTSDINLKLGHLALKLVSLAALSLIASCASLLPSARSPDFTNEALSRASIFIGGTDKTAATLNWDYTVDLKPLQDAFRAQSPDSLESSEWMLKRVVSWKVQDLQSGELLHSGQDTHFFVLGDASNYTRSGPLFNLWRSLAYSAQGPVIDGVEQGPVLKRPRLRRGQEPNAEEQALIEEIERAFSSKSTQGFVSYTDSFALFDRSKFEANESNGFYNFPARTRSGPWKSEEYPLGALVNSRRDYEDFGKYRHSKLGFVSTSPRSFLSQELAVNNLEVHWKSGEEVLEDDFIIQNNFSSF